MSEAMQAGVLEAPASAAPREPEMAIRTHALAKRYRGVRAVDGVELRVPRGKIYGFIGLNGAGKSTLIRILMGLERPTSGAAFLNGVNVALDPVRARTGVGYVPDRPTAYGWMRVREAIALARAVQPRWNDAAVDANLRRFRLDPEQRIGRLSKGGGAKLSLLLAMGHDPDLLILDEPTDGLDAIARDEFLEEVLGTACESERTILVSSHALDDVERLADVVGLIHNGRLLVQCPTAELVADVKRIRAVLEAPGGEGSPPPGCIWSRADGREWVVTVRGGTREGVERMQGTAKVRGVSVEDLSLAEIFKDYVRGQEAAS